MTQKRTSRRSVIDLSVVIPAFKEAKRIGPTLDKLSDYLQSNALKNLSVEVIVVAADSGDRTAEIADSKSTLFENLTVLRPGPRAGKGRDVKAGMLAARGNIVMFMDADLATPLHHLSEFLRLIEGGNDVVVATRDLRKHHPEVWRRSISLAGNVLYRILCGSYIEDSQCGFKMFTRPAAQTCFRKQTINGWGFDMEILAIAHVNKLRVKAYPIDDWVSVAGGTFTDTILKTMAVSFAQLFYIAFGRLTGRYKAGSN